MSSQGGQDLRVHDFDKPKAIAMASLEFDENALIWWDKYKKFDKRKEKPPLPLGCEEASHESKICAHTL